MVSVPSVRAGCKLPKRMRRRWSGDGMRLNVVGVTLFVLRVVPEPVVGAIGEEDERRLQVLGVAARLLLRRGPCSRVLLPNANDAAELIPQKVISTSARCFVLVLDLLQVLQVPFTRF